MRELVAPSEAIFLDAKFESELVELGDDDEAREMLAEMGVDEPGLDVLARVGFDTLGLQTYLTAGPKESRAWTIRKGATAPEAAGVIHTDFQKGFIKAEIVSFDDLMPPAPCRRPRRPARCAWRARTTSWRTATSWSSASTCEFDAFAQVRGGVALQSAHSPQDSGYGCLVRIVRRSEGCLA